MRMRWYDAGSTDTPNPAATRPMMVIASPASWAKCGLKPASRARLSSCAYRPLP
jgi:hypothetical protein